ncbi:hypothetical protein ACNI3K_04280 [Demequina sp. SO4-13]|uniref:hypothetical protein n=1 Tax=Demequina sp. SO4-13 TaxID=3401027 RepID=UPI003AF82C96
MARGFNYAPGAADEVEIAGSPTLQRAQISALAQSRNSVVREVLAARGDLALGQMVTLAHDRSTEVRGALAANPAAAQSVLEHLAEDRQASVLTALIANPAAPPAVVERLAFHRKSQIRFAAAQRMNGDAGSGGGPGVEPSPTTSRGGPVTLASRAPEMTERTRGVDGADEVGAATDWPVAPEPAPPGRPPLTARLPQVQPPAE